MRGKEYHLFYEMRARPQIERKQPFYAFFIAGNIGGGSDVGRIALSVARNAAPKVPKSCKSVRVPEKILEYQMKMYMNALASIICLISWVIRELSGLGICMMM